MLKCLTLDPIFHALADPTRRFIVEGLCDGQASVSEIAEPLPLALSTILQHLKVLERSGLIHTEKRGAVRSCRLEPQGLQLLGEWVMERRYAWDADLARLVAIVKPTE
jgi:DNA-binding transcriptional ArsR family regulator